MYVRTREKERVERQGEKGLERKTNSESTLAIPVPHSHINLYEKVVLMAALSFVAMYCQLSDFINLLSCHGEGFLFYSIDLHGR